MKLQDEKRLVGDGEDRLDDTVHDTDIVLGDPVVGKHPSSDVGPQVRVLHTPKEMSAAEFARHCVTHLPMKPGCK